MSTAIHASDVRLARTVRATARPSARGWSRSGQRLVALVALLVVVSVAMFVLDRGGAQADLQERVAGHVVVEPGQTLWDVAVATAPDGVDTRQQLADLQRLNGLSDAHVDQWTVVLLPAR